MSGVTQTVKVVVHNKNVEESGTYQFGILPLDFYPTNMMAFTTDARGSFKYFTFCIEGYKFFVQKGVRSNSYWGINITDPSITSKHVVLQQDIATVTYIAIK